MLLPDLHTDFSRGRSGGLVFPSLSEFSTNKVSGGGEIPAELFQIIKRWCCESAALSMPANLEKSAVATRLEKVSFHSSPKERQCQRMYHTIALISHTSKVMLKSLQVRLQQHVKWELPDVQARFRKAEEPETKLPTPIGTYQKQKNTRKTFNSALLTMPKPLTVWITPNYRKFWKR